MTILNLLYYSITANDLSVGDWYQNLIFYVMIILMAGTNVYLIRAKQKNRKTAAANNPKEETPPTPQTQQETDLEIQLSALKQELLAAGQELELSYANADRLNTQFDFKEADKKDALQPEANATTTGKKCPFPLNS